MVQNGRWWEGDARRWLPETVCCHCLCQKLNSRLSALPIVSEGQGSLCAIKLLELVNCCLKEYEWNGGLGLYSRRHPENLLKGIFEFSVWLDHIFEADFNSLFTLKIFVLSDVENEVMRAAGRFSECFDWAPCFSREQALYRHVSQACLPVSCTNFKICWPFPRQLGT